VSAAGRPAGGASEHLAVVAMLHDEVLQGVIAARWALDDIEPADLSASAARALAQAIKALDRAQEQVRDHIVRLQSDRP
jgi:hypothetical protein